MWHVWVKQGTLFPKKNETDEWDTSWAHSHAAHFAQI
jgi:hypothetical protein